ncbi:carotenoid biosynthesis protein [Terracidiphilus gabretensis]|uniref:carotenoid biosynthesis protein n=1 Tax=Terracidiphilus gabretensis TaxID=1577687 RepID=UPI00071BB2A1|nr:carotenoid biosynthesis protein [Terracidiphilus gabretensis]
MPLYPGMPYGPAPAWALPFFDCCIIFLFVLCLLDAWRRGRGAISYLLGGMCFGLVLEYLEVASHSYTYGHFLLMLGHAPMDIPVSVGLAWGIILYTSRLFSDGLRLPWVAAAALDTLLALNLDMTMDVVAYRMHMWHWDWTGSGLDPLKAEWFGIPYANFVGWISVVFFYSFFSRLYERTVFKRPSLWRFPAVAVLALFSAQVELLVTEYLVFHWLNAIHIGSGWRLLIEAVVLLGLVGWGMVHRSGGRRSKMPGVALWVPAWFHVYFVIALVELGFFRESAWMTLVAGVNIAIGLVIHLWPALGKKAGAGALVWAETV